jgi:hypothetical protein
MLEDESLIELIDEFFFELHFNCEIMMPWWRTGQHKSFMGLPLDRFHALDLFLKLRKKGVRAHIWP